MKLWIVGKCFLMSFAITKDGFQKVPCEPSGYEVFESSTVAMKYINTHEGLFNLMEVEVKKQTEFSVKVKHETEKTVEKESPAAPGAEK